MPYMSVSKTPRNRPRMAARCPKALITGGNGQNDQEEQTDSSSSSDESDSSSSEEWESSCICGIKEDNYEDMVRCDQCILRWEHVACIFPSTKAVPAGPYYCHVCKPRPTELTPEQARAYQDEVQKKKDDAKKRKSTDRPMRKNSRTRLHRRTTCEFTAKARDAISVFRPPVSRTSKSTGDVFKLLSDHPPVRSLFVEPGVYGLVTTEDVHDGAYIAELIGSVSMVEECPNRDLEPDSLNDHTFLMDEGKIIIDARKCGNVTRYMRRSCKPNAVLKPIFCGSKIHIMIKAIENLQMHEEVSIELEEGWRSRPRPAQGCGCDKQKNECDLERFFNRSMTRDTSSPSRKAPDSEIARKPPTSSRSSSSLGGLDAEQKPTIGNELDAAPDAVIDRSLRRRSSRFTAQANEQPVVEKAAKRKEPLLKKRELPVVKGETADEKQVEKRVRVSMEELFPVSPTPSRSPSAVESPPHAGIPPVEEDMSLEGLARAHDMVEPNPGSPPPSTSHSTEVDWLRKELANAQEMYQRARFEARVAELRAERAENLLDVKPEPADPCAFDRALDKKLAGLTSQLDEARKEIDKAHNDLSLCQSKKQEVARENDSLKAKLVKLEEQEDVSKRVITNLTRKNGALEEELETVRIAAEAPTANELDLTQKNAALKAELDAAEAKVAEIPTIRDKAAKEVAALKKSLDTLRRLEEVANEKNDVLTRENLLLKEVLAEKRKDENNKKIAD